MRTGTKKGIEIRNLISRAQDALGEAPVGLMNDAVTALAEAFAVLVANDGPLWEPGPVIDAEFNEVDRRGWDNDLDMDGHGGIEPRRPEFSHFTRGPWRYPVTGGFVVANAPTGEDDEESVRHYGGHLVAESIRPHNLEIIVAAPAMFEAIRDVAARLEGARAHDCKGADCTTCYPNGLAGRLRDAIAKVPMPSEDQPISDPMALFGPCAAGCGRARLDGHHTCGEVRCNERSFR